eukprot:s2413_g25.t1
MKRIEEIEAIHIVTVGCLSLSVCMPRGCEWLHCEARLDASSIFASAGGIVEFIGICHKPTGLTTSKNVILSFCDISLTL